MRPSFHMPTTGEPMNDLTRGKNILSAFISSLVYDPENAKLDIDALPEDLHDLGKQVDLLATQLRSSESVVEKLHAKKRALEKSAFTDPLTGVGNRAGFNQYSVELWADANPFTVAFVDIDNLKYCNDRFGHAEGNRYILQVSRHLLMACGEHDRLFRIGGDEFVLISTGSSEDELAQKLARCRQDLIDATSAGAAPMTFSFSYGCSRTDPGAGDDRRQMTLDADRKMYGFKLAHCNNAPASHHPATEPQGLPVSDRVFQALAMTSTDRYFFVWNLDTKESQWSASAMRDFNLPSEHPFDPLPLWLERVHPDDRENVRAELDMVLFGKWHFHTMQYRVLDSTDHYVTCDCKGYRLEARNGENSLYVGTILNRSAADSTDFVTGLGDAHSLITALGECRKNGAPTSFVVVKVNGIAEINSKYGYAAGDRALYETADIILDASRAGARVFRMRGTKFVAIMEGASQEDALDLERTIRRSLADPMVFNGDELVLPLQTTTVFYDRIESQPYAIMTDLEKHIERDYLTRNADGTPTGDSAASQREPLTGLFTGSAFLVQAQALKRKRPDEPWCVAKIDLGHMRVFNEWYGKETGDLLLKQVAARLQEVEQSDLGVAGYWGQDDFCVFIPLTERMIETIFYSIRSIVAAYDDSIGFLPAIGVFPVDPADDVTIDSYSRAVFTARRAKRDYKNRIRYFNPVEYREREREYDLLSDFQRAIAGDEITFFLQPQVDIVTGKIVGAEALARWFHRDGTSVSPADFIPVLEQSGFIVTLDKFIWRSVFTWLKGRLVAGKAVVPVSINVSRTDILSFDVAEYLADVARYADISPALVNVEITETAYASDEKDTKELTARLRQAGFAVHMDDFGSGLSSLSMLRTVTVDAIKMDQRFMQGDDDDKKGRDIVTSMVAMAQRLNLPVVAEGVETEEQVEMLKDLGDCAVQGFYYYRPMRTEDVEPLLDDPSRCTPARLPR